MNINAFSYLIRRHIKELLTWQLRVKGGALKHIWGKYLPLLQTKSLYLLYMFDKKQKLKHAAFFKLVSRHCQMKSSS